MRERVCAATHHIPPSQKWYAKNFKTWNIVFISGISSNHTCSHEWQCGNSRYLREFYTFVYHSILKSSTKQVFVYNSDASSSIHSGKSFLSMGRSSSRNPMHLIRRIDHFTAQRWSCGKVMFSVMCVCPRGNLHVTIAHDALDLTSLYTRPTPSPLPPNMGPHCTEPPAHPRLVTSDGHYWRPVQTCSLEDHPSHCYWHLVTTAETCTGRWASYWKTLLWKY